jgi:capsular polysaccharide biosynthesis protein
VQVKRRKPYNLKVGDEVHFMSDQKYVFPPPKIYELANCFILKDGAVIHKNRLFQQSLADTNRHAKNYTTKFFIKSLLIYPKRIFLRTPVIIVYDAWSGNLFHWLNDVIPRLILSQSSLKSNLLILPESYKSKEYIAFSIEALGITKVEWIPDDSFIFAKTVILPSRIAYSGNYDKEFTLAVPRMLRKQSPPFSIGEKVYISRGKAEKRRIVNEAAVVEVVKKLGFACVYLEDYSFEEQIGIASKARIMLSVHGAGLTHMMFMKKRSIVVEMRTKGIPQNNCYFNLADVFNHTYLYLFCDSLNNGVDFQNDDLVVNIDELSQTLLLVQGIQYES